ncbi:hypothetical protein HDU97_008021 [Phlyctochytrium planicorne]|nr:hypothetical protein HDU97_008021 [Phlyctochytrium planicorne]
MDGELSNDVLWAADVLSSVCMASTANALEQSELKTGTVSQSRLRYGAGEDPRSTLSSTSAASQIPGSPVSFFQRTLLCQSIPIFYLREQRQLQAATANTQIQHRPVERVLAASTALPSLDPAEPVVTKSTSQLDQAAAANLTSAPLTQSHRPPEMALPTFPPLSPPTPEPVSIEPTLEVILPAQAEAKNPIVPPIQEYRPLRIILPASPSAPSLPEPEVDSKKPTIQLPPLAQHDAANPVCDPEFPKHRRPLRRILPAPFSLRIVPANSTLQLPRLSQAKVARPISHPDLPMQHRMLRRILPASSALPSLAPEEVISTESTIHHPGQGKAANPSFPSPTEEHPPLTRFLLAPPTPKSLQGSAAYTKPTIQPPYPSIEEHRPLRTTLPAYSPHPPFLASAGAVSKNSPIQLPRSSQADTSNPTSPPPPPPPPIQVPRPLRKILPASTPPPPVLPPASVSVSEKPTMQLPRLAQAKPAKMPKTCKGCGRLCCPGRFFRSRCERSEPLREVASAKQNLQLSRVSQQSAAKPPPPAMQVHRPLRRILPAPQPLLTPVEAVAKGLTIQLPRLAQAKVAKTPKTCRGCGQPCCPGRFLRSNCERFKMRGSYRPLMPRRI